MNKILLGDSQEILKTINKMEKLFLILIFTLSINSVFADSPLTSTDFYKAYLDIPLIQKTANSKGILTDEVFEYLTSKNSFPGYSRIYIM